MDYLMRLIEAKAKIKLANRLISEAFGYFYTTEYADFEIDLKNNLYEAIRIADEKISIVMIEKHER